MTQGVQPVCKISSSGFGTDVATKPRRLKAVSGFNLLKNGSVVGISIFESSLVTTVQVLIGLSN